MSPRSTANKNRTQTHENYNYRSLWLPGKLNTGKETGKTIPQAALHELGTLGLSEQGKVFELSSCLYTFGYMILGILVIS